MKGQLLLALIRRPRGVALLALGLAIAGLFGLRAMPVSAIPAVDLPTILVSAALPGASPETMSALVAAPLEESLGTISGIEEITSTNVEGLTRIVIQFDLDRDINGAARDVQAAITTSRNRLPRDMPFPPIYQKINPEGAPALFMAVTSETHTSQQLFDIVQRIIVPEISRQPGVGGVVTQGAARSAVRVRADPEAMRAMDLGFADLRAALMEATQNMPKGTLRGEASQWAILANDQAQGIEEWRALPITLRGGRVVRLDQVATVDEGLSNERIAAFYNGRRTIFVFALREPGANLLQTATNVRETIPRMRAVMPASVDISIIADRSDSVLPMIEHAGMTVALTMLGIALVVLLALQDRTLAAVAVLNVPLSLLGTVLVMKAMGFSLNIISLGGLAVSIGLVVDDAIVVVENVKRLHAQGRSMLLATLRGTQEVTFTIIAITLALVTTLAPLLALEGPIGVVVADFAVTVTAAVVISGFLSLTLTPALIARLSPQTPQEAPKERRAHRLYVQSLRWAVDHPRKTLLASLALFTLVIPVWMATPKTFLPLQDTGTVMGIATARPDTSFTIMSERLKQASAIIARDPDVESVSSYLGSRDAEVASTGRLYISLKPYAEREGSMPDAIERLRAPLQQVAGLDVALLPLEDLRVTAREGVGVNQFALRSEDAGALAVWLPRLVDRLKQLPSLRDVSTDQFEGGLRVFLDVDRDALARIGGSQAQLSDALYSAFGQRQVVLVDRTFDQMPVVLESGRGAGQETEEIDAAFVASAAGRDVPIGAIARTRIEAAPVIVTRDAMMPAATIWFNVAPGHSLGEAVRDVEEAARGLEMPGTIKPQFAGNAAAYETGLFGQPLTFLLAALAVYLVLGILYESFLTPLAILGTLPVAALGSLLGLLLSGLELSVVAFMGLLLVAGIMMKNAIILVNFAVTQQRQQGLSAAEAMFLAGTQRFRPILMTSFAALLGALPIAILPGMGEEFRQPLGMAVAGGLIAAQAVTLYTTPALYILLDRLRARTRARRAGGSPLAGARTA